jgi:predicted Rdx family selenoprotein
MAMQLAEGILDHFGPRVKTLTLTPGEHGVFKVQAGEKLVFDLDEEFRPPKLETVVARIDEVLGKGAA